MGLVLVLAIALFFGLLASYIKLPPMLGFLFAGFLIHAAMIGLIPLPIGLAPQNAVRDLNLVADTGVTLLLFTIGLKLDLRSLFRPEVVGTAITHMAVSTFAWSFIFWLISFTRFELFDGTNWKIFFLLGFALAFSSTILVVKMLGTTGETDSRFGVIAIGVLVIQDLAAAVFMSIAKGHAPTPWAILLLLLFPGRFWLRRLLGRVGRDELLIILGIFFALGGYQLFESVNIKGDLGAIVMGALIASHPRAKLLADRLFSLRELLLAGFFLSIGQYGLPGLPSLTVALLLTLALPLQTLIYLTIFRMTRLRVRTGAKSALLLTNYSEFGLIAGVVATKNGWLPERWMVALALAVTLSFVAATLINKNRAIFVNLLCKILKDLPTHKLLPGERPVSFGDVNTVVFGMGNLGSGAYRRLSERYGQKVRGIDQNSELVQRLRSQGFDVMEGDATDPSLWERIHSLQNIELVILAMPDHGGNRDTFLEIQKSKIQAFVSVVAKDEEELEQFEQMGANLVLDTFSGAGAELADATYRKLHPKIG